MIFTNRMRNRFKVENKVVSYSCVMCDATHTFSIPFSDAEFKERWRRWLDGEYIQNAFYGLSADNREAIQSCICPNCFDEVAGG